MFSALFAVSGYIEVEVSADNIREAKILAYDKLDDVIRDNNITELESLDVELIELDTVESLEKAKYSK
jgi:hypothetical protein